MCRKKLILITGFAILGLIAQRSSLATDISIRYQNRGNRYEGIKPIPVSGYDIELISVFVDYREIIQQMPDQFRMKFYLDRPFQVHITVRELDCEYYYWMDKVKPSQSWRSGFNNVFEWPTAAVIQHLEGIRMYDLGIIVRLEKSVPSKVERVAPVIFYHTRYPETVEAYLFTLKAASDARLACKVYNEEGTEPVFTKVFRRVRGGRPFTLRWDSSKSPKGYYKLVVTGYLRYTNDPIDQTVHFYHQPIAE